MSSTLDTYFICISIIFLLEDFTGLLTVAAPVFFTDSEETSTLRRYHQLFQRMQSPRNIAHSCWPRIGQRLALAASWFFPQLKYPRCFLDPGLSLYRVLLGLALPLFDLVREVSEVRRLPMGNAACGKWSFHFCYSQVFRLLLSILLQAFYLFYLLFYTALKLFFPHISIFFSSGRGFSHSVQLVSLLVQMFHGFIRLLFCFCSYSLGRHPIFICELDDAASLLISCGKIDVYSSSRA